MVAKNDDGFGKIIEAYGRAAAARSGLDQIYDREGDRSRYNSRTIAALQPDGTYRSWAHDALDMIYRGDLNKQAKAQAKALYSNDIYEMHKAREQLKLQRGTGAERFGKGVYNTVDKTIELTGKVVGPVYREAVRPAISALWNGGKQLIGGLWNGFTTAVAAIYEDRMNRRQNINQANDNQRNRDRTEFVPNNDGRVIFADAPVNGEMYGNRTENRAQENSSAQRYTPVVAKEPFLKYCKRRVKEEVGNVKRRFNSASQSGLESQVQDVYGAEQLNKQAREAGLESERLALKRSRAYENTDSGQAQPQYNSDDFFNEYLHVDGSNLQKQINGAVKRARDEKDNHQKIYSAVTSAYGDAENVPVEKMLRMRNNSNNF